MMFAGYSHWDAGVTMANYIAEHYPPGTKVAIIHAAPGYVTEARSQVDLHKENGMDIVFEDYAYAERMRAYDSMKRIIAAYPDTEVVLCMSSMMAVGATEAMIAHGMEGEFDIYGSGGTIEELLYIEDGLMTAAWMRDPIAMGKAAAEAIYLHMSGQEDEIDLVFDSPIHIIDSVEAINLYVNPVLYEAQGLDFPR